MRAHGDETVTLWRAVGQQELDLVAASGWRAWPLPAQPIFGAARDRAYATRIARTVTVPAAGVGYVTGFDVLREFLDRQAGERDMTYRIPAGPHRQRRLAERVAPGRDRRVVRRTGRGRHLRVHLLTRAIWLG